MIRLDTLSLEGNTLRMIQESVNADLIEHNYIPVIEPMEWVTFFETKIKNDIINFIAFALVVPTGIETRQVIVLEAWQINDEDEFAAYLKLVEKWSKRGI
jgi:hypothetical protein